MPKPFYAVGAYVGQVTGQALGETSNGNMQFVLRFKVLGAPDPDNPENYLQLPQQFERTIYLVLNANTIEFAMEQLQALGFDRDSFKYLDPKTPGFQDFTGVTFDAWCKHDSYNNEEREKWNISTKPGGGMPEVKPVDPAKVRQLDALFAAQLKKNKKVNGAPKPNGAPVPAAVANGPATNAGITDDDGPF